MATAPATNPIPPHVPANLVEMFDFRTDAGFRANPHQRLEEFRDRYRAFYTPYPRGLTGAGIWVLTNGNDIRTVLQDSDSFASGGLRPFGKVLGEDWGLIPVDLDPPVHGKFRAMLNPIFSPKRIAALEVNVTSRCSELLAPLKQKAGGDFMVDFARPFPVSIFLELMGLPLDRMPYFVELAEGVLHGAGPEEQVTAIRQLRDYLATQIAQKRAKPSDDLMGMAVTAKVDGRPLTEGEVMGLCFMLFIGGLDTVTSTLGFVFHHLATHPDQQARLRANPAMISDAAEELLRLYNVVITGRRATRDVDIAGVTIKEGDQLALPTTFASRNPAEFANPGEADLTRNPNRHSAFGFGPHRCIGSHLARRELVLALEGWLSQMPPFQLAEGAAIQCSGTGVVCVESLPLRWD